MKTFLSIVLCLIATVASAAQKSGAKLDYDAAWEYSLTVTDPDSENYFTLSLLNTGQLAYDYWVDSSPESEKQIKLSPEQASSLKAKFADAFKAQSKASDKRGPTIALENIQGRQSTTWTATGATPEVTALLDAAKSVLVDPYPFAVK